MTGPDSKSILVADPDLKFLEKFKQDSKFATIQSNTMSNNHEAHKVLSDTSQKIIALIVNPIIDKPVGISIIRSCRLHRPGIPIYAIYDKEEPFSQKEANLLGISEVIKKPITFPQIVARIANKMVAATPKKPLPNSPENLNPSKLKTSANDSHFISIPADLFLAGTPSIFDLYIRLASGKYVKILPANQSFDMQQLENYYTRGVTHFHLSRVAHIRYMNYCTQVANQILKDRRFSIQSKMVVTLAQGEETMTFLSQRGIDDKALEFAALYVKNLELLIQKSALFNNSLIQDFIKDIVKYEHGVSTSIIASLLSATLGFGKDRSLMTVGIASLLHDVGLMKLSTDLYDLEDNESVLNEAQKKEYRTHPALSAEILSAFSEIDPIVVQAVGQHHERRTMKGFPLGSGPGAISRVAEIIGLSDEFVRLIKKAINDPFLDVFQTLTNEVFNGFSFEVTEAFRKTYFPKSN